MATVASKLMTAEEFMQLPDPRDGSQQELIKGVIVTMPPPKPVHGLCCVKIVSRIGPFVEQHNLGYALCNDSGFVAERDPDTVYGPDVAFWTQERLPQLPEESYPEIPPDLAIEVVSPSDTHSRVQHRMMEFLKCGVKLIWLADPILRIVTAYRALDQSRVYEEQETLTGEEILPGFSCKVSELFP